MSDGKWWPGLVGVVVVAAVVGNARGHACYFSVGEQHHNGTITVPDGTASIPDDEYRYCDGITGVTFNTDGALTVIGSNAFQSAGNLTGVTIPASVTSMGDGAFQNCDNLARIVFDTTDGPSELKYINYGAFGNNPKLEVAEIPESVHTIYTQVLDDCPLLNRVIVHGSSPWNSTASLNNLVVSLCDRNANPRYSTGQACIEGNESRAAAIINHASNDCNLACCPETTCTAAPAPTTTAAPAPTTTAAPAPTIAAPPSPPAVAPGTKSTDSDADDPALGTGAIVGIAVGGAALLGGLVWYLRWQSRQQIVAHVSRATTRVGELIF